MDWNNVNLDRKTRIFLIAVGIALLWLLWPSGAARPRALPVRPAAKPAPKPAGPQPARGIAGRAAAPLSAAVPSPPATVIPPSPLLGIYGGRVALSGARGTCALRLELRRGDKPEEFSGFTRLVCTPPASALIAENEKRQRGAVIDARAKDGNPTMAILNGTTVDGTIRLHAVKNFGLRESRNGCEMTDLSGTPAGTDTIDVEWHESPGATGVCHGAQMQMRRTAR